MIFVLILFDQIIFDLSVSWSEDHMIRLSQIRRRFNASF
jgi:hypothetical protein